LSEYSSKIQIEKVLFVPGQKNADVPRASPGYYGARLMMASYNQVSGILIIQIHHMRPRSHREQAWRKGASIK